MPSVSFIIDPTMQSEPGRLLELEGRPNTSVLNDEYILREDSAHMRPLVIQSAVWHDGFGDARNMGNMRYVLRTALGYIGSLATKIQG